jgi:hypothetical protein
MRPIASAWPGSPEDRLDLRRAGRYQLSNATKILQQSFDPLRNSTHLRSGVQRVGRYPADQGGKIRHRFLSVTGQLEKCARCQRFERRDGRGWLDSGL